MRDISFVDTDNMIYPSQSNQYKKLAANKERKNNYILCYHNINSSKVPKVKPLSKIIEKQFVIPIADTMNRDEYTKYLELLRGVHFDKTVASIYGIHVISKAVAEFSPFLSQICAGTLLTDKKGRVLTLMKQLEDGTDQLHVPQTHIKYTPDIYVKSFNQLICDSANNILNETMYIKRIEGELEPINLISGYIVNTSENLATSMHTLFTTVYQIDDFEKYEIRCRDKDQKAMILELHEAIDAARTHMMDPWLSYVYSKMVR